MRSRWRPSPDEERWLEVESRLGSAVARAVVTERTGGWRSTVARNSPLLGSSVSTCVLFQ